MFKFALRVCPQLRGQCDQRYEQPHDGVQDGRAPQPGGHADTCVLLLWGGHGHELLGVEQDHSHHMEEVPPQVSI